MDEIFGRHLFLSDKIVPWNHPNSIIYTVATLHTKACTYTALQGQCKGKHTVLKPLLYPQQFPGSRVAGTSHLYMDKNTLRLPSIRGFDLNFMLH